MQVDVGFIVWPLLRLGREVMDQKYSGIVKITVQMGVPRLLQPPLRDFKSLKPFVRATETLMVILFTTPPNSSLAKTSLGGC